MTERVSDHPVLHLPDGWNVVEPNAIQHFIAHKTGTRPFEILRCATDLSAEVRLGTGSRFSCPLVHDSSRAVVYAAIDLEHRDFDAVAGADGSIHHRPPTKTGIVAHSVAGGSSTTLAEMPSGYAPISFLCLDSVRDLLLAHLAPQPGTQDMPCCLGVLNLSSKHWKTSEIAPGFPLAYLPNRSAVLYRGRDRRTYLVDLGGTTRGFPEKGEALPGFQVTYRGGDDVLVIEGEPLATFEVGTGKRQVLAPEGHMAAVRPSTTEIWFYRDTATLCRVVGNGATQIMARFDGSPACQDGSVRGWYGAPVFTPDGSFVLATLAVQRGSQPCFGSVVLDLVGNRGWLLDRRLDSACWVAAPTG